MNPASLHAPTVTFITAVVVCIMTLVMLATWRFNRGLPGLRFWGLASLGGPLMYVLLSLRGLVPEVVAVLLTNLVVLTVSYLTWVGCCDYVGQAMPRTRPAVLTLGGVLAAMVFFTVVQPSLDARIALQSLALAGVYGLAARTIAVGGWQRFPARHTFALALAAHALFLCTLRPWMLLAANADPGPGRIALPGWVSLESMLFFMLLYIGVVMLTLEHIAGQLIALAENDPLTSVFNRRAFMIVLEKAHSRVVRQGDPLSLMVIDLDHFKRINDTWGHKAGDDVLRHFVHVAAAAIRHEDVIGRLGGEEFCVFLPGAGLLAAGEIAERLRQACEGEAAVSGRARVRYTVSIGVAQLASGEALEDAIHRADQAMYRAKRAGRNRVETAQAGD